MTEKTWEITQRHATYHKNSTTEKRQYTDLKGKISIEDLLSLIESEAPPGAEVVLNVTQIQWDRPATAAEIKETEDFELKKLQSREKYDRAQLEHLYMKYGNPFPPKPIIKIE